MGFAAAVPRTKQTVSLSQPSTQPWSSLQSEVVDAALRFKYFSPTSSVLEVPSLMFEIRIIFPEVFEEGTKGLDLAVGAKGEIFVLDPVRNQIRKFMAIREKS